MSTTTQERRRTGSRTERWMRGTSSQLGVHADRPDVRFTTRNQALYQPPARPEPKPEAARTERIQVVTERKQGPHWAEVLVVIALLAGLLWLLVERPWYTPPADVSQPGSDTPAAQSQENGSSNNGMAPSSDTMDEAMARTYDPANDYVIGIRDASGVIQHCPRWDSPIVPYLFVRSGEQLHASVQMPKVCYQYLQGYADEIRVPDNLR